MGNLDDSAQFDALRGQDIVGHIGAAVGAFENILRTHSLNRLMKFLKGNMGAEFSKNTQTHMRMIDGFYFSTRYPGDDSIEIDGDDVETCNDAIELCRTEVLELERELKKCEV